MSTKSKKIYCGVDELKANQRLGTPQECAELKQVRYYGLKKIDKKYVDEYKGIAVESDKRQSKLIRMITSIRAEILSLKDEINDYKEDPDYKKFYVDDVKKMEKKVQQKKKELKKLINRFKEYQKRDEEKDEEKENSKKSSKKDSKKTTKKDSKKDTKKDSKKDSKKEAKKSSKKDSKKSSKKDSKKSSKKDTKKTGKNKKK